MTVSVLLFGALAIDTVPSGPDDAVQVALLVALIGVPISIALLCRRRARLAALSLVVAAIGLRLVWYHVGFADQIAITQAAYARVLAGGKPYGFFYPEPAPGAPLVYGPLAIFWHAPGPDVELLASVGILLLLWRERAWLTLSVFGALELVVRLTTVGINDYSPGLLLLIAAILMRERPIFGAVALAAAAAIKPYAFAWFPAALGYGGLQAGAALVIASAVLWSPLLLLWGGPASYVRSLHLAEGMHPLAENALNLPALRVPLAALFAALGLFVRTWEGFVIGGSAVYVIVLFLADWASLGYWVALVPVLGLTLERGSITRLLRASPQPAAAAVPTDPSANA
jgi:hypothetical protein